jgi:hypothetical protein
MNRQEFESLWNQDKSIIDDVVFVPRQGIPDSFEVENLEVIGENCEGLRVNMTYDCFAQSLVCNFTTNAGAIHRYCIGTSVHGAAGRFHEHHIRSKDCVRQQLPHVVARNDMKDKTSRELWDTVCGEANISFTGVFFPPEAQCK